MKKHARLRHTLLSLLLVVSSAASNTYAHAKKTFLMPRPVMMNKAIEHNPWDAHLCEATYKNKCIHNRFQTTSFYQHSTGKADIGEYFGIGNCKNCFTVGSRYDFTIGDRPIQNILSAPADVEGALMTNYDVRPFVGTVCFKPDQEVWGTRLQWDYFKEPQQGFFLRLVAPLVEVTTDMNMCIANNQPVVIADAGVQQAFTLADFFAGNVKITDDEETRINPLCKSKICGSHSHTGLADLDVVFGYRHHCSEKRHWAGNIRVTIPTGSSVTGEYLFEPVLGNGGHIGLGTGFDMGFEVWSNPDWRLWVEAGLQYTYLFQAHEVRMLGVKGFTELPPLAHYMMMTRVAPATPGVGTPLFPAANELTQRVDVTPGSHVEALFDLSLQRKHFVFDMGYNLYWRAREAVKVLDWNNNTFGIIRKTFVTSTAIETNEFLDGKFVNCENLDTAAAETPEQWTHKFHGGCTYRTKFCSYPTNVGIGASYECASSNTALDQYAVWFKGSILW